MKKRFIYYFVLLLILSLAGCSSGDKSKTETSGTETSGTGTSKTISVSFTEVHNDYNNIEDIYNQKFQDSIKKEIQELKETNSYSFENPLVINNPYCTLTDGLYIYFKTEEKVQIRYTVTTDQYGSFEQVIYENDDSNLSTEHETTLIGMIPDTKNKVTLTILDKNGNEKQSVKFDYHAPEKLGKFDDVQATVKKGESTKELENGLYVILGNDVTNDKNDGVRFLALYDNSGILRCEIPIIEYRANRILLDENGMYFSVDHSTIVRMEDTGYLNRIYKTDPYEQHHDCIFGNNNDLLVLGSDPEAETTEDLILDIDLETGEARNLIDMKDYLEKYYAMTSLPEGENQIDWMHLNSLTVTDDGKLLLSSRETSTIIVFKDFYNEDRRIDFMLGSDSFWSGTGYENLLFDKVGDFSLHSGQHNITYIKDSSLDNGEYYLIMYNNNNTYSSTRPDYDWVNDDNYTDTGISTKTPAENSYYYEYLVNEKEKTYELVKTIAVPYSAYVSSIQNLDNGNVLIDSGSALSAYEFDSQNKLIQSLTVSGTKWTYRITKYDFKGFWFK